MSIRNFWVQAEIDGRKTKLAGGPASKRGGMEITLYQRENGAIEKAVKISCREHNGELITEVYEGEKRVALHLTER